MTPGFARPRLAAPPCLSSSLGLCSSEARNRGSRTRDRERTVPTLAPAEPDPGAARRRRGFQRCYDVRRSHDGTEAQGTNACPGVAGGPEHREDLGRLCRRARREVRKPQEGPSQAGRVSENRETSSRLSACRMSLMGLLLPPRISRVGSIKRPLRTTAKSQSGCQSTSEKCEN
jgi:hypothetical protein